MMRLIRFLVPFATWRNTTALFMFLLYESYSGFIL
jgi:hypothetical protein